MIRFTIPLPPRTKKNGNQIVKNQSGKYFLLPSKAYRQYEKDALWFVPKLNLTGAVNIVCLFYMDTLRSVDLTNLEEAIDDIMVKAGAIKDDSFKYLFGHDGSRVLYDKEKPRTEVYIFSRDEWYEHCGEFLANLRRIEEYDSNSEA